MPSIAQNYFPQVVFRNGSKRLWNPIQKQDLKDRPEERVRQRLIDFLIVSESWSQHRLGFEIPIYQKKDGAPVRADLVCYSRDFSPEILIECKSEKVSLKERAAEQIAGYNQHIQAPYLLLTNGLDDLWYDLRKAEQGPAPIENPLPALEPDSALQRGFKYWSRRGFIGKKAVPEIRRWSLEMLEALQFVNSSASEIHYLSLRGDLDDLTRSHYYRILPIPDDPQRQIALSVTSTPYGGTRFVMILAGQKGMQALMAVNLDLLQSGINVNTTLYWHGKPLNFNAKDELPLDIQLEKPIRIEEFSAAFLEIMSHYATAK